VVPAGDAGDGRRAPAAPGDGRPTGGQPPRDPGMLTTRYRAERERASTSNAEVVGFVQAP
jgi:hypothetical protein